MRNYVILRMGESCTQYRVRVITKKMIYGAIKKREKYLSYKQCTKHLYEAKLQIPP